MVVRGFLVITHMALVSKWIIIILQSHIIRKLLVILVWLHFVGPVESFACDPRHDPLALLPRTLHYSLCARLRGDPLPKDEGDALGLVFLE